MARQKVTIPKSLPEFIYDEPHLSVKQRLRAQTEAQLDKEEKQLQEEYDRVISSASGPLAQDWTDRWNEAIERRRALTQAAPLARQAQQLAERYVTPTMVMAPGQREQPPNHNGRQSPVPGFGAVLNEEARRRIRGISADRLTLLDEELDPALLESIRQGLVAGRQSRGQRNDQHWQAMMQGQQAPTEPEDEVTTAQRREQNERLYQALEGPRAQEAADGVTAYTRARMREQGWSRQLMLPDPLIDDTLHADNPAPVFHDLGNASFVGTPQDPTGLRFYETHGTTIGNARGLGRVDFATGDEDTHQPRRAKRRTVIVERPD